MKSKQQVVVKSDISPVLFLTLEGEPMSFFLRPGPVKRKLQPLITAGGGLLCNVQQPGAILLIDPEERGSVPQSTAHWYVSSQYIQDCIEKDEQLNLEDYRLNPEVAQRHSARLDSNKESSPVVLGGRIAYTPEEDAAILSYVSNRMTETKGNRLWREMEKQRLTGHSWQSMKYRYRVRLAKRQSEVVEVETTEEEHKGAEEEIKEEGDPDPEIQEIDVEKPSSSDDAASPQTHSAESDLTQIDSHTLRLEIEETPPSDYSQEEEEEEEQLVDPQTDKPVSESTQVETVEAETSSQPEGLCLDPQTDAHLVPAESTEPETDETQTIISPQKENVPEDSPPAQLKSPPDTSSHKKPKEKRKASPEPEPEQQQLPHRVTCRQLKLDESFSHEPCGRKLRSSQSSVEQLSSSPQPPKKSKSAAKSPLQKETPEEQPPPKKARGKGAAAATESQQEESGQAAVSETAQADTESNSSPEKGEKRKLGILELASDEFEDEIESGEAEAPVPQNPTEAASTWSRPEHGPSLEEEAQETLAYLASRSDCPPQTGRAAPAAAKAVDATSAVHLFIFDTESQEEDSQSLIGNRAAPPDPQPTVNKNATFPLTQNHLEEDKRRITELMNKTDQDLVAVTKALLKTSGDFSAAQELLLNPSHISGPFWNRSDDRLLLSADPAVQQQLLDKYGEASVAKRIMFLEAEQNESETLVCTDRKEENRRPGHVDFSELVD